MKKVLLSAFACLISVFIFSCGNRAIKAEGSVASTSSAKTKNNVATDIIPNALTDVKPNAMTDVVPAAATDVIPNIATNVATEVATEAATDETKKKI